MARHTDIYTDGLLCTVGKLATMRDEAGGKSVIRILLEVSKGVSVQHASGATTKKRSWKPPAKSSSMFAPGRGNFWLMGLVRALWPGKDCFGVGIPTVITHCDERTREVMKKGTTHIPGAVLLSDAEIKGCWVRIPARFAAQGGGARGLVRGFVVQCAGWSISIRLYVVVVGVVWCLFAERNSIRR
jgi:hypothetical protein